MSLLTDQITDPAFTGGGCEIEFAPLKLRIGDMNLSTGGIHLDGGVLEMQKAQLGIDAVGFGFNAAAAAPRSKKTETL